MRRQAQVASLTSASPARVIGCHAVIRHHHVTPPAIDISMTYRADRHPNHAPIHTNSLCASVILGLTSISIAISMPPYCSQRTTGQEVAFSRKRLNRTKTLERRFDHSGRLGKAS